jgi:hypothetical protein
MIKKLSVPCPYETWRSVAVFTKAAIKPHRDSDVCNIYFHALWRSMDSICSLDMDSTENTASKSYSIVVCALCLAMALVLLSVTQPLPNNGCFSGCRVLSGLMSQYIHTYTYTYIYIHRGRNQNQFSYSSVLENSTSVKISRTNLFSSQYFLIYAMCMRKKFISPWSTFSLHFLYWKNKRRLMKFPFCSLHNSLCLSVYPSVPVYPL